MEKERERGGGIFVGRHCAMKGAIIRAQRKKEE